MSRVARPGDYKHAEHIIRNYKKYQQELRDAEVSIALRSPVMDRLPVQRSGLSDPTGSAAVRMDGDRRIAFLRQAIKAVEQALFNQSSMGSGAAVVMMVKLLYWDRSHTLEGASMKVGYSYIHARRLLQGFVVDVMCEMGWDVESYERRL